MMNNKTQQYFQSLTRIGITGNLLFFIWILLNGIKENFEGTIVEKVSYLSLMGLLLINAILLIKRRKSNI